MKWSGSASILSTASEVNMALIEVVTVLALLSVGSLSQVITDPPQNAAVVEGDDTTFNCTAENNGSPITVGWGFTPSGSSSQVGLSTGTNLTGIEMVTVSGVPRTTLTFSGVRREANGGMVQCIAQGVMSTPVNLTVLWPPVLSSERMSIFLLEGESDTFNFTVDDIGNPPSTMNITGPSQPGNARVSISSEGVVSINGVSVADAGTHIATWRNDAGNATFTLDLIVITPEEIVFGIGLIIGISLAIIAFIVLVIVVAVVLLVCCICCECCICYLWCNKGRQKRSEDEEEDKGVSLT